MDPRQLRQAFGRFVTAPSGFRIASTTINGLPCAEVGGEASVPPAIKKWEYAQVRQVEVAVIGTGWCGGIRAETLARSALVDKLHICEIRPARLAEVKAIVRPATATLDYQDIVGNEASEVVY